MKTKRPELKQSYLLREKVLTTKFMDRGIAKVRNRQKKQQRNKKRNKSKSTLTNVQINQDKK